jgi:hypothetical protein
MVCDGASTRAAEEHVPSTERSPVVLLTVVNVQMPVTLELMHHVLSNYGHVQRLIVTHKAENAQVLPVCLDVVSRQHASTCCSQLRGCGRSWSSTPTRSRPAAQSNRYRLAAPHPIWLPRRRPSRG